MRFVLFFTRRSYFESCQFPFQAVFQHIFSCAMADMAEQVSATQKFSVEFEDRGTNRLMSTRFWKGNSHCKTFTCRSGIPSTGLSGELSSLSQLQSVVSTKADVVACSGDPLDFVRTIDQCDSFPRGVQCCYRFAYSVFRI